MITLNHTDVSADHIASSAGQPLPLTRVHKHILEQAVAAGDGDLDNAAVFKQLRRLADRGQET